MEGIIFYWVSWMVWIMATFFMKKDQLRLKLSWILLVIIIASPHIVPIFQFEISMAGIFLCSIFFYLATKMERLKMVYGCICAFIIMLAYVCFHLFELFDPVWLIFPRNWMLSVMVVFLALILQENKRNRMYIIILGSFQGEILYALILSKYSFPYLIASLTFLDTMTIALGLVALWNGIELLASFYEKYFNQLEREKQKLS
ncbi:hypothetical protein J2Z40_001251 [Cytobacillus eiseniae]|uniref:Uncharacterized protein n=1 Tax=Cytobacillus eiseniae TaxID=762947 RepID=A0ABS4RFX8_9BACI|nr:hypothetical protein [Cytobacillus eiseniae]MBP2240692.1 hypothetical protein [Cytobacillus eiseniae]